MKKRSLKTDYGGCLYRFNERQLTELGKALILDYNKWLFEHGYTDSDIIDEFKIDDYWNKLNTDEG